MTTIYTNPSPPPHHYIPREPAVAGQFYPSSEIELRSVLKSFFKHAHVTQQNNIRAIIAPHAGYMFSGQVAASAYKTLNPSNEYQNIFIIGSSHHVSFNGISIYNQGGYITPLGEVEVNQELANQLINENKYLMYWPPAHSKEHGIEVQLPFLQYHLHHPFKIIPIIIGTHAPETINILSDILAPWFNNDNLLVISSDFAHYPSAHDAQVIDKQTLDVIKQNDPQLLIQHINNKTQYNIPNLATSLCGWTSVLALLYLTRGKNYNISPVAYNHSGSNTPYGDKHRVVGYYGVTVSAPPITKSAFLTDHDQNILLNLARQTIKTYFTSGKINTLSPGDYPPVLNKKSGAFISLYNKDTLRGCMGRFTSEEPLVHVIQQMVLAAATNDYRFNPVTKEELPELAIEISVLSPLKSIKSPHEIELGKHGIYIKQGSQSGTYLPQVANKTAWTLDEFLGHCCKDKAGLEWDSWRDPETEIFTYETIVFKE